MAPEAAGSIPVIHPIPTHGGLFRSVARACLILLLLAPTASAEVVRIEIRRRDDFRAYVRLIGRIYFAVDPAAPANRNIADLVLAPTDARGKVEFSADVLFFQPKAAGPAGGTVFFEIVNRGRDQSLGLMSGASQEDARPEHWDLGDRFALDRGFTLAFLGWQFDVPSSRGLTFQGPIVPVAGTVRANYVEAGKLPRASGFVVEYCAADPQQADATLTFRSRIDGPRRLLPRESWQFGPAGCSVRPRDGFDVGLYEAVYRAKGSPVAGLGLAAVRDFASYLKYGGPDSLLRTGPARPERVIGFGYSQSGRFLREFVRDGFNQDERGRIAFDGLMIASAGAGGGSFNHRFAMPGQAGNSVLSILRPVDLPPFTDDGLLAKAQRSGVTPRIFYTFSSTEYWARAGSLTHTTEDGANDVPLAASSRLYFLAGTPHAEGPLPPSRGAQYQHDLNFAEQRWTLRALLLDMDAWIRSDVAPPPSRYPTIARGELVSRAAVRFPRIAALPFPSHMPQVWRTDYGADFAVSRIITKEPPELGQPYAVLVPQVNADGNDEGGIQLPETAVPLGTYTGWNMSVPALDELGYLAGLAGSFEPFVRTRARRIQSGDARLSIDERYRGRKDYLDRVSRAAQLLVAERFLLPEDVRAVVRRAAAIWTAVVDGPSIATPPQFLIRSHAPELGRTR